MYETKNHVFFKFKELVIVYLTIGSLGKFQSEPAPHIGYNVLLEQLKIDKAIFVNSVWIY